jgi:hypothetical protein
MGDDTANAERTRRLLDRLLAGAESAARRLPGFVARPDAAD